jgi:hypothetical protein
MLRDELLPPQSHIEVVSDPAATWCQHATAHAEQKGGTPWKYLLIPHDQIQEQMTLAGLAARYTYDPKATSSA